MDDCIFCSIIEGKMETNKVYENDSLIVIKDIAPRAPIHLLIIPKAHIASLAEIEAKHQQLLGEIMLTIKDVAKKMGIIDAFKVDVFSGEKAGQTVFHLHFHLLGGWKTQQTH